MILGILTLIYLDDRVAQATWLTADEKRIIAREHRARRHEKEELSHLSAASRPGASGCSG